MKIVNNNRVVKLSMRQLTKKDYKSRDRKIRLMIKCVNSGVWLDKYDICDSTHLWQELCELRGV